MNKKQLGLVTLLTAAAAAAAIGGARAMSGNDLDDLITRTRQGLVFVQGGTFKAGNYETEFLDPDGTVATRWVYEPSMVLPPYEVTLDSFYLQDRELSHADFNLFLRAQGEPELLPNPDYRLNLPDHAAAISWQEAEAYCAWLGELTELPLRLPTEAEWEFAARSRDFLPPWATNDGSYHEGENLRLSDRDQPDKLDPPIASFAPNPLGLHDMAGGLYEWVSDRAPTDPDSVRIYKGGNNYSTILREVIPTRGMAEPLPEAALEQLPEDDVTRYRRQGDKPIHVAGATLRCVATITRPPAESGFGRAADLAAISLPGPFGFTER